MSDYLYVIMRTRKPFNVSDAQIEHQIREKFDAQIPANFVQYFYISSRVRVISKERHREKYEVELEPAIKFYDFRGLHTKKKKRQYINLIIYSLIKWVQEYSDEVGVFLVSERPGRTRERFETRIVSQDEFYEILLQRLPSKNILFMLQ